MMHTHLVRSADEVEVMILQEVLDDVFSEREGHPSVVLSPTNHFALGIRPQQIAQQPWTITIHETENKRAK